VIGEEGDENGDVKTKEKWFGKQNRKEDETKMNQEVGENIHKKMIKGFWKWFLK